MADDRKKRRRRRSGVVEFFNVIIGLLMLGVVAIGGLFLFGASQFYADGPLEEQTSFFVERNDGLGLVAQRLESQRLISSQWVFRAGGMALEKQRDLKPGEFIIPAKASMAEILAVLSEGKPVEYFVTVPEGETSWGVIQRLAQVGGQLTGDLPAVPAEGTILPGRYDFMPRDTAQSVLDQMTSAMTAHLAEVWQNCRADICGPQGVIDTPAQLVTLASIVEKETGVAAERPQVASVFVNRLRRGMRLQSDPTIIYGITNGEGTLGRPIRKSEIEARTAYNTYQIGGLPPGPIANPGIEALRAVADPAQTDFLYFVAAGATPDQGHLFATSYADHRRNVAQYRRVLAQAEEAAEAEAAREALEAAQAEQAGEPADAISQ